MHSDHDPSLLMPSFFGKYPLPWNMDLNGQFIPCDPHHKVIDEWLNTWKLTFASLSPGQWPTQLSCLKIWANGHKDHGQSLLGARLWIAVLSADKSYSHVIIIEVVRVAETINKQRKLICREEDGSNKQLRPQGLSKRTRWSRWLWFLGAFSAPDPKRPVDSSFPACWWLQQTIHEMTS